MQSKNNSLLNPGGIGKATKDAIAAFSAPTLKFIPLSDIAPDPNQPRKHYNEDADQELFQSIQSKGVLQAILVRPMVCTKTPPTTKPDKGRAFLIICGERRYLAACKALKLDPSWFGGMIPAQVREMSDEEAKEAQIIENLQREDVHPLDEALAFEYLTKKGLTQEEIGARVGKGDRFVRARLVLCKLIKPWKDLFGRYAIDLETAVKVSRFSDDIQKEILAEARLSNEDLKRPDLKVTVRDFSPYQGDLSSACFDLADPELDKKSGACINCRFNTASGQLFPDDVTRPRCTFLKCFKGKSDKGLQLKLMEAKSDPTVILVKEGYRAEDEALVKELKAQNYSVLSESDFREVGVDNYNPGTFEEWKAKSDESNPENDYGGFCYDPEESETRNRTYYERELKDWIKQEEDLAKGLKTGRYKKALVVQGDDHTRGTMINVLVQERQDKTRGSGSSGPGETPAQKVAAGKASISDLILEISRLEKDVKDTQDRERDKSHLDLVKAYKEHAITKTIADQPLAPIEKLCLLFFLLNELDGVDKLFMVMNEPDGEDADDINFAQALGIEPGLKKPRKIREVIKEYDANTPAGQANVLNFLQTLDEGKLALIFRRAMLARFGGPINLPSSRYLGEKAWIMRLMITAIEGSGENKIDISAIEEIQKEKAGKRIARAKERIKDLKKQKSELEKKKAEKAAKKAGATPKKDKPIKPVPGVAPETQEAQKTRKAIKQSKKPGGRIKDLLSPDESLEQNQE